MLLWATLSTAAYSGPALAANITSSTDTSWRFQGGTYNFADGLRFSFSDDRIGAIPIGNNAPGTQMASPKQEFNVLGQLDIGMTNGTQGKSIGANIDQFGSTSPQQSLIVTGDTLHLFGEYTSNSTKAQTVAGLYMDAAGSYDPNKTSGAYALFNNTNTFITAVANPSVAPPAYSTFSGVTLDHGSEAIFNGNADISLEMGANGSNNGTVLLTRSSQIVFNGDSTKLTGTSASTSASKSLYGAYVHGRFTGGTLYERQTNLLFNGKEASIDVSTSGNSDVYGIYAQGGYTTVTDEVENFSVSARSTGTASKVKGIESWHHEIVDIQAKNTTISTHSDTASAFNNTALFAWTNGNINIGGEKAVITSSGSDNGAVTLYSLGQASSITLAPDVTGNLTSDITINADDITITSTTTGTGETIAAYVRGYNLPATIHVNSDATGADQGKTVNVTGTIYAKGNVTGGATAPTTTFSGKAFFNFGNTNSQFTGQTKYWPENNDGSEVNIGLTNNARWNMTGDSWVTNFTAGGGHAYLGTDASHFTTLAHDTSDFTPTQLWIANLKSTNGNFYLRADIDGDKADTVFIRNGTGAHNLYVRSHGAEPSSEAMNQYLVHKDTGDASFTMGNPQGLVDAGFYAYELAERDVVVMDSEYTDSKEWYLRRTSQKSPTGEAEAALSGIAGNYALWYGQQTDLRKRLGEIRYGAQTGLWARGFADKTRLDGFADTSFTQNTYGGSIGYDTLAAVDETYMWMLGMQLRAARADQHVNGHWGGTGDLSSLGVGLYSTWAHTDGWYVDAVATYDHYNHEIRTTMLDGTPVHDDRSTYGLGASLETGRKFDFAYSNNNRDYWFFEPQLQLSYFWVKGGDFTASNGMKIEQDDADSLTGRAGVVLGKKFALGSKPDDPRYVQPYIKAGVNHEFLGDQVVHINNTRMNSDLAGTRVYYGAGIDWQVTDNLRLYTQVEREHGEHFTREFNVSAGLKWEF